TLNPGTLIPGWVTGRSLGLFAPFQRLPIGVAKRDVHERATATRSCPKIPSCPTNSHFGRSCLTASRRNAVMNGPALQTAASKPKRRRFRFGMRDLIGAVLLLGLVFGWLARMHRQAVEREALVAELARDRVIVNSREPTLLCLVLSKLLGERTIL